jgi:adenylosuccinate synthase
MADLRDLENLKAKLQTILDYKNKVFGAVYNAEPTDAGQIFEKCKSYADRFLPFTTDTTELLHTAVADGKSILFEGAQGTLLDIDHGTFPFVTSSNSSSLGMPAGCGVPAKMVDKFLGVAKAYTTRVGSGPFPSEQDNETGQYIRDKGHEYGTTTGRPRRCGWFDAVVVRQAVRLNGLSGLALTKLDVLTGFEKVRVCTAYEYDGKRIDNFPASNEILKRIVPVYQDLPGWDEPLDRARSLDDLPANTRRYVQCLEELTGVASDIVSVGARRGETIILRNPFAA